MSIYAFSIRRKILRILTLDNETFIMSELPEEIDDLRFCVLDNSNPADPDYFFIPLIFLETFNAPAVVLNIDGNIVKMPLVESRPWSLVIGDKEIGELEVVSVSSINDRGLKAFTYNPLSDFRPDFKEIEIVDVYQELKWYFPRLKPGQLVATPLRDDPKSPCVFIGKEISRQSEIINRGLVT